MIGRIPISPVRKAKNSAISCADRRRLSWAQSPPEDRPMTEAFIYDAVRTPRGRGKASGALHSVTPMHLAVTALQAIRDRSALDTSAVDDVVLGCVEPVGEQGADIARVAVLAAGLAETTAGVQ